MSTNCHFKMLVGFCVLAAVVKFSSYGSPLITVLVFVLLCLNVIGWVFEHTEKVTAAIRKHIYLKNKTGKSAAL